MMILAFYKVGNIHISESVQDLRWWIIPPLAEGGQWELKKAFDESYQQLEGLFDSYDLARRHASAWAWRDSRGYGVNGVVGNHSDYDAPVAKEPRGKPSVNKTILNVLSIEGVIKYDAMYQLLLSRKFAISKTRFYKHIKNLCGYSAHNRGVMRKRVEFDIEGGSRGGVPKHSGALTDGFDDSEVRNFDYVSSYPKSKKIMVWYGVRRRDQQTGLLEWDGQMHQWGLVNYREIGNSWSNYYIDGHQADVSKLAAVKRIYKDLKHLIVNLESDFFIRTEWYGDKCFVAYGDYVDVKTAEKIDYDRAAGDLSLASVWKNRNTEKAEELKKAVSFKGVPDE